MTGQTRRKPSVPAPAPQRTAATHASGAHEFSYRFAHIGRATSRIKPPTHTPAGDIMASSGPAARRTRRQDASWFRSAHRRVRRKSA